MRQLRRHLHKKNGTFKCLLVPFRSCNPDGRANNFNGNWNWMLGSLQVQTCSSSLVVLLDLFLFAVGRDIIFLRTGSFFCCFFFGLCLFFCLAIHSRIRILHIVLVSSMCCGCGSAQGVETAASCLWKVTQLILHILKIEHTHFATETTTMTIAMETETTTATATTTSAEAII